MDDIRFNVTSYLLQSPQVKITRLNTATRSIIKTKSLINQNAKVLNSCRRAYQSIWKLQRLVCFTEFGQLLSTAKPDNFNTVIGALAVKGWAPTFGTARRGLGGFFRFINKTSQAYRDLSISRYFKSRYRKSRIETAPL